MAAESWQYVDEIKRLLLNWAKNTNPLNKRIELWAKKAERWEIEEVSRAVDKCIDSREYEPKGWADFLAYLPARAEDAERFEGPWWSQDGDWGGDWSRVPRATLLYVAAVFQVARTPAEIVTKDLNGNEKRETRKTMGEGSMETSGKFLQMVYRRRSAQISEADVLQAVNYLNEGGASALRAFAQDPEGFVAGHKERQAMWEGIQRMKELKGELPARAA